MSIFGIVLSPRKLARVCALTSIVSAGVTALTLAMTLPVAAQVVYDEGSPNQVSAFTSDAGPGGNGFLAAETFYLDIPATFNAVEWYGTYGPSNTPLATDAFTILIFDTTANVPNAVPILTFNVGNAVNRTATGQTVSDSVSEYFYSSILPSSVSLSSGTYGISIVNDTTADTDDVWSWESTGPIPGGQHFARQTPSGAWSSTTTNLSFRVLEVATSAPEPGSIALLALPCIPLAGMVVRRKWKQQRG